MLHRPGKTRIVQFVQMILICSLESSVEWTLDASREGGVLPSLREKA